MKKVQLFIYCLSSLIFVKGGYYLYINFTNSQLNTDGNELSLIKIIPLVIIIAPIIETSVFQVLFYRIFRRNIVIFMIFSCLCFTLWHYHPNSSFLYYLVYFMSAIIYNIYFIKSSHNKKVSFGQTVLLHASYNCFALISNIIFNSTGT